MIHQIFYLHAIGLNHHVTEYPLAKTGGYPRISPVIFLSTTTSLFHMVIIEEEEEEGKYLFFLLSRTREYSKKTSQAANSKLFVKIFFCAFQNIWRTMNTIFCAKIYLFICPWTLSVLWSSQFSLSFALAKLFAFGTDNVNACREIFMHIFVPNWGYSVCIPWVSYMVYLWVYTSIE